MVENSTDQSKSNLRRRMKLQRRREIQCQPDLVSRPVEQLKRLSFSASAIAAYWPMSEEVWLPPFLTELYESDHFVCLPVITGRGQPMIFRQWRPGDEMETGGLGEAYPKAGTPLMEPDILLVPFLAFDRQGHRLGYGGGYFDRTLKQLRLKKNIVAVGVGYGFQEVENLPSNISDEALDLIVTEQEVVVINSGQTRVRVSKRS